MKFKQLTIRELQSKAITSIQNLDKIKGGTSGAGGMARPGTGHYND